MAFIKKRCLLRFLCVTGIMDAWKGNKSHVILSRVGDYKVFYQDVFQMGPGQELESEVHIL